MVWFWYKSQTDARDSTWETVPFLRKTILYNVYIYMYTHLFVYSYIHVFEKKLFMWKILFKIQNHKKKKKRLDSWLLHRSSRKPPKVPGFKLDVLSGRCAESHFRGETKNKRWFFHGSWNATYFGGIKQCKYMVFWPEFPYKSALFGLIIQWPLFLEGFFGWSKRWTHLNWSQPFLFDMFLGGLIWKSWKLSFVVKT